jgi:hypothetical protein
MQLQLYRLAASELTGLPATASLFYLRDGSVVELDADIDVPAAIAEIIAESIIAESVDEQ